MSHESFREGGDQNRRGGVPACTHRADCDPRDLMKRPGRISPGRPSNPGAGGVCDHPAAQRLAAPSLKSPTCQRTGLSGCWASPHHGGDVVPSLRLSRLNPWRSGFPMRATLLIPQPSKATPMEKNRFRVRVYVNGVSPELLPAAETPLASMSSPARLPVAGTRPSLNFV